jgi:hypothetical protein
LPILRTSRNYGSHLASFCAPDHHFDQTTKFKSRVPAIGQIQTLKPLGKVTSVRCARKKFSDPVLNSTPNVVILSTWCLQGNESGRRVSNQRTFNGPSSLHPRHRGVTKNHAAYTIRPSEPCTVSSRSGSLVYGRPAGIHIGSAPCIVLGTCSTRFTGLRWVCWYVCW